MIVDNFDLIKQTLYFNDTSGLFFFLQVINRGKDHPDLSSGNKVIKTYFIQSGEHLESIKSEIITFCQMFGARAYVNIAPKSFEDLTKLVNFKISERLYNGDFKKIYRLFNAAAGELKPKAKRWIIDIDNLEDKELVINWLDKYFSKYEPISEQYRPYLYAEIPTVSGIHLIICATFNLQEFKQSFPNIDVHKNNPTLLYAETRW